MLRQNKMTNTTVTTLGVATAALAVVVVIMRSKNTRETRRPRRYRRRTSLSSAFQANRPFLEKNFFMKQNMINTILMFEDAPTRDEMVAVMTKICHKFERMRCHPVFSSFQAKMCEWEPLADLEKAIGCAITVDESVMARDERAVLQRVEHYKAQTVSYYHESETTEEGSLPMPLWRVIVIKPSTVLIRIDHAIGDGMSLVSLLREVGTRWNKSSNCKMAASTTQSESFDPLRLGEPSPILRSFEQVGDLRIRLRPLVLLWPPNLWRAISFLVTMLSAPEEAPNPLRPRTEDIGKVVPEEFCGTVYFPTMSLLLFKKLALAVGNDATTINDVVLFCLSDTFRRYFLSVGVKGVNNVRLVLPIANPLPPSFYGDEYEGLCNRMTPVLVPLDVSNEIETDPTKVLEAIETYTRKVKRCNVPMFLTTLNTIFQPFMTLKQLADGGRNMFDRASCVYSTVPGPLCPIAIAGHRLIKVQTILPHSIGIFQVLSYNGNMFFNITLDTRSAPRPWLLRDAFVDSIRFFSETFGVRDEQVQSEIEACSTSEEWGGRGVVLTYDTPGTKRK